MRLRNKKGSWEFIDCCPYVVPKPCNWKGRWHSLFRNQNPIHLEIGVGKGRFIRTMAMRRTNVNYIGIEKYSSVLYRALEGMEDGELNNLLFIRTDAESVCDLFQEEEITTIYLNFSDPWPKKKHEKRRLTSRGFLERYGKILTRNGTLQFKTDNEELFDYSLNEMKLAGWNVTAYTRDLHQSQYQADNVMTEYEEKFMKLGYPIYQLVARYDIADLN